jgi:hypothetical protein
VKNFKNTIIKICDQYNKIIKVVNNKKRLSKIIQINNDYYLVKCCYYYENTIDVKKIVFNINPQTIYHNDYVFECPYCSYESIYTHFYDISRKLKENKYISKIGLKECVICNSKSLVNKVIININIPIINSFEYQINEINQLLYSQKNKLHIQNEIKPIKRCRILKLEEELNLSNFTKDDLKEIYR